MDRTWVTWRRRAVALAIAAAAATALAVIPGASVAGAQEEEEEDCGPYGCDPTPPGQDDLPPASCDVSTTSAAAGDPVQAIARNVPNGITVDLRVNGETIASQAAVDDGEGDERVTDVEFDFDAPTAAGEYEVVVVGPAYQAVCTSDLAVLGTQFTREPTSGGTGATGSGSAGGGGSLPRTGLAVGLIVAVGIGLVVVGRSVYAEGRRRQTVQTLRLPADRHRRNSGR